MTIIGPVLFRQGLFAFDIFSMTGGLRRSFGYRVVDEAIYDRNMTLIQPTHLGCATCAEFAAEWQSMMPPLAPAAVAADEVALAA